MNDLIEIEVVFANKTVYELISLRVPLGTTILQAIQQSGILTRFPEITLLPHPTIPVNLVGVFGQLKDLNTCLQENDRVEIYRPLCQSAMQLRKQKAEKIKKLQPIKDRN